MKNVRKLKSSYSPGGSVKCHSPLWKAVSQVLKTLNIITNDPARDMKTYPNKNLYMNIHSSSILNSQKVETTQLSINRWINKQNVVYPPHWNITYLQKGMKYWLRLQHEWTLKYDNKRSQSQKATCCMILHMNYPE